VAFDKPVLISPINNEKVADYRPAFRFRNAPHVGSPQTTSYALEIATTDSFTNKVAVWQFDEKPNETSFASAADLPPSVQLFWRVRAFESPVLGPWSDAQVFRTPTPVAPTPPPGAPPSGGSCSSQTQPFNVVKCRREQYGAHMSSDQTLAFEKSVASDLNKSSIGGGPYGVLKKSGGASCGGYACDIICTGSGSSQKQWDILGDSDGAQTPAWSGPNSGSSIRADVCEVQ
jgi:hypothetical protein